MALTGYERYSGLPESYLRDKPPLAWSRFGKPLYNLQQAVGMGRGNTTLWRKDAGPGEYTYLGPKLQKPKVYQKGGDTGAGLKLPQILQDAIDSLDEPRMTEEEKARRRIGRNQTILTTPSVRAALPYLGKPTLLGS
jgi:hypothetical protein